MGAKRFIYTIAIICIVWIIIIFINGIHNDAKVHSYLNSTNNDININYNYTPTNKNSKMDWINNIILLCVPDWTLGNKLSLYWGWRAIAYNLNMTYLSNSLCAHENYNRFYEEFLPDYYNYKYDSISNISYKKRRRSYSRKCIYKYPHTCDLISLYYNQFFIQTYIVKETHNALSSYFFKYKYKVYFNSINKYDIVIHYRCGDLLRLNLKHYSMMKYDYYEYVIKNKTKWFDQFNYDQKINIWILAQLTKDSEHNENENNVTRKNCYNIAVALKNKFINTNLFRHNNIIIVDNTFDTTLMDDLYLMIHAPLLVCGTSTFCLNAAMANKHTTVLPMYGPWDLSKSEPPNNHIVIDASNLSVQTSVFYLNDWYKNATKMCQILNLKC